MSDTTGDAYTAATSALTGARTSVDALGVALGALSDALDAYNDASDAALDAERARARTADENATAAEEEATQANAARADAENAARAAQDTVDALRAEVDRLTVALDECQHPPTTPPAPVIRANAPAGFALLTQRGFLSLADPADKYNTTKSEGWDPVEQKAVTALAQTGSGIQLVSDASAPASPPSVLNVRYAKGFAGGSAPCTMQTGNGKTYGDWQARNIVEWYCSFVFKHSTNWFGHPSRTNKFMYFWLSQSASSILPRVRGTDVGPLTFNIGLQGEADPREDVAQNGDTGLNPNVGDGTVVRGKYHEAEMRFRLNTPGKSDGRVLVHLNGKPIIDVTDWHCRDAVKVPGSELYKLTQCQITPVWGGTGSTVPADQDLFVDEVYVSAAVSA